jgi:hypothetical protein
MFAMNSHRKQVTFTGYIAGIVRPIDVHMTSRLCLLVTVGLLLAIVGTASAESHPAWWRYASPEATALVGIEWDHLRSSPFAGAITGEFSGDDGLGFPDLDFLKQVHQILISSPVLLAAASGNFPAAAVLEQATKKGLKRTSYRDVEIWVTPGKDTLSIARMSDQLVLLGRVKDLKDAIDRGLLEGPERVYSPLLARGARYAQDDLWVVAARLPDPLADHFVPIDVEAEGFEGAVSLKDGLHLTGIFSVPSEEAANQLVEALKPSLIALPLVTKGIQIRIDDNTVTLSMAVSEEQLRASLRATPTAIPTVVAKAAPAPAPAPVTPARPQVVRIYGLDEGTREIVLH